MTDYGLTVFTYEHIQDLAESIKDLPARRLEQTWAYVQAHKYNGMIQEGDCAQPNIIFQAVELPLIRRIYPEEVIFPKVKKLISYLAKTTKEHSNKKFHEYLEMRRRGIGMDEARKRMRPHHTNEFLIFMAQKYDLPFKYRYGINCTDADVLFNMGLDPFLKLFYDRFYYPVTNI